MRQGAVAAERPKLGRPPKKNQDVSPHIVEQNSNKNSSVKSRTSLLGPSTGNNNECQQSVSVGQPITGLGQTSNRPISNAPRSKQKPARIQTGLSPTRHVTPSAAGPIVPDDLFEELPTEVAGHFSRRPARSTRNPSPLYVDSLEFSGPPPFRGFPSNRSWSASAADLEAINRSIRGV